MQQVHFDDETDDDLHHSLKRDEVSPLDKSEDDLEPFQVGDQLFGFAADDGAWYPCEIVEVCFN